MELPARIVIGSANPDKAAEMSAIFAELGLGAVQLVPRPPDLAVVDETEPDFLGNARLKAVSVSTATGLPALADDSGLEVDVLGGAPGVRSARYAGLYGDDAANVAKLLDELAGAADRTARFRCVIVLRLPDGIELVADGSVDGTIAAERSGEGGFGYDPVFVPVEGDGRTFAEMTADEKHAISHRGRALRALAAQLLA